MLHLQPITFKLANEYVSLHHRHNKPTVGCKFCIGVSDKLKLRGVVIVGRPIARHLDDGYTLEITRCCTDGAFNACSMLYAAAWRATKALGYLKLITYILSSEKGSSLRAAGFYEIASVKAKSWSCPSRPRKTLAIPSDKKRYQISLFP